MNRFDDYPYGPFFSALNTLLGRIFVVIAAVASLFYGIGLWAFPMMFLFALGFVLREWRLRYALLCTVLMWVNIHCTIRWTEFDGPMAQTKKALQEVIPAPEGQGTTPK